MPISLPFDGSKKSAWFVADLNGWLYTFMGVFVLLFALSIVLYANGVQVPDEYHLSTVTIAAGVIAFIIVFVLRRNFTVIGARRDFTYFPRWL